NCLAVGAFNMEHALFAVTGGVCRCGFDDPPPAMQPTHEPTDGASLEITFSGATVAFEGETGRPSDALRTKKSTRVRLTVSAYGGPNGGTVSFTRTNFAKLRLVGANGFELPSTLRLEAGQAFFATSVCEGVEASAAVNDIVVSGRLVEEGETTPINASACLTSCSVTFVTPSGNPAVRAEETDTGDGQNEFTFDDATQTLTIGLKVRIEPDVTQLAGLGQCVFTLPLIRGADLSWEDNDGNLGHPAPQSAGSGALAQTTARYVGYPLSNSEFGRKTVTFHVFGLTVAGDFEVFFPSDGTHHPACSTCSGCPNWFYYWREGSVCIPNDIVFLNQGSNISGSFDRHTKVVSLSAGAVLKNDTFPALNCERKIEVIAPLTPDDDPCLVTNWIYKSGDFSVGASGAGIRAVALAIKHEIRHKEIFLSHEENELSLPPFAGDVSISFDDEENVFDGDQDGVWNDDEISARWGILSNEKDSDTYRISRFSSGYVSSGDDEIRARLAEEEVSESAYHLERDWCNPGCQSKVRRGPMNDDSKGGLKR
ncbi:MAG: hypothetical protein MJ249_12705, partial [Kiritimatiellae bacterium]|nr:hypothetical protein [Kiritimatiellia bacterium]